ncbi:RecQ-mediated genome instability protein 1 [Tanacetum coccineum]
MWRGSELGLNVKPISRNVSKGAAFDSRVNGHGAFSLGSLLMLDCILSCRRLLTAYLADYCFQHILIRLGDVSSLTYQFTGNLTFGGAAGASSHFFVCSLDYAKTRLENGFTAELLLKLTSLVGTTPASVNERVSSRTEVESSFSTRMENLEPLPSKATTDSSVYMETENASFVVSILRESFLTMNMSEILIDHSFVQKTIAYSPEEVIAAISSSDPSRGIEMKNRMEEFQDFFSKLRAMVLRIDEASSPPTALDLQQGCPPADAWSLLTRLNPSNADQHPQLDPIDLSP